MDTITLTGTFVLPDGTPDTGTVRLAVASPAILQGADPALVTAAQVVCVLDETGAISVEVVASDDPSWATVDPVPYRLQVRTEGLRADYYALVTGPSPVDIADLLTLDDPPDVIPAPDPPPDPDPAPIT